MRSRAVLLVSLCRARHPSSSSRRTTFLLGSGTSQITARGRLYSTKKVAEPAPPIVVPEYKPPSPEEWAQIDEGNAWHEALREKLKVIRQGTDSIQNRAVFYKDDDVVVLYDRFPKAHIHMLIMPFKEEMAVDTLQNLSPAHLKLFQRFAKVSAQMAEKLAASDPLLGNFGKKYGSIFSAGFHAVPSLYPIHMHFLSRDLAAPGMKSSEHYLSFTSPFFLQLSTVYNELKTTKTVADKAHMAEHLKGEIFCHLDYVPFGRKMAKLKHHLQTLWNQNVQEVQYPDGLPADMVVPAIPEPSEEDEK